MRQKLSNLIKQTVRGLRKGQTESESVFWRVVKNRQLLGKKFLRQHPIVFEWRGKKRFLIADFYCHEARLVVEIDGGIHEKQKDYDEVREFALKSLGFIIIRLKNAEIDNDLAEAIDKLKSYLVRPLFNSSPSLSKRGGSVECQRVS